MISVIRDKDKKVFTTDMSKEECIYEMHFCTSYTQVLVQEFNKNGWLDKDEIICPPVGTKPHWVDQIAILNCDTGVVKEEVT